MTEMQLLAVGIVKLFMVLIVGTCYSLGGRDEVPKWARRFLAPFLLTVFVLWFQVEPQFLLLFPILAIAYSLGYGRKYGKVAEAIIRTFTGLLIACAGLPIVLITGEWWLFGAQCVIATIIHPILGLTNPVTASQEELLIGVSTILLVPFYV